MFFRSKLIWNQKHLPFLLKIADIWSLFSVISCIQYPFWCTGRNYAGETVFSSLNPLRMLNATCLNQISILFVAMVVNLAFCPLSWRWLNPKYCSTIYLTFDIFLFLLISRSVSLALVESFLMIPSPKLFRLKNSRFGKPAYPLSA